MSYLSYGDRELFKNARALRKSMTLAEKILWSKIRSRQIKGLKFRRQQPILKYIVDFYCHPLKLIIEVDGEIHELSDIRKYDLKRANDLINHGFHVLRFSNYEVEFEIDPVIKKLHHYLLKNFPELFSEDPSINEKTSSIQ